MNYRVTIFLIIAIGFFIWVLGGGGEVVKNEHPDGPAYNPQPALLANFVSPVFVAFSGDENMVPKRNWQVANIETGAKSALAVSFDGKRIYYEKNSRMRLPMASLTKLMTALVVAENYDLDKALTVLPAALTREGERGDLRPYEKITVRSLLAMMLVESSNDAAMVLAQNLPEKMEKNSANSFSDFVNLMNQRAWELELRDTRFENPDGLDSEAHYSTALDLSNLFRYLLEHYPRVGEILRAQNMVVYSADGKIEHRLKNSNDLLGRIPEIEAGKTGFTDNAGGSLILFTSGFGDFDRGIITVILGSDDRFGESEKLINWLRSAYIWK